MTHSSSFWLFHDTFPIKAIAGSDKLLLTAFSRLKNIIDYFNLRENILVSFKMLKIVVKTILVFCFIQFPYTILFF
jgi:hypothetical protein